jgi:hypothetical protein
LADDRLEDEETGDAGVAGQEPAHASPGTDDRPAVRCTDPVDTHERNVAAGRDEGTFWQSSVNGFDPAGISVPNGRSRPTYGV